MYFLGCFSIFKVLSLVHKLHKPKKRLYGGKMALFCIHIPRHRISSKNLEKVEFTLDAIAISWKKGTILKLNAKQKWAFQSMTLHIHLRLIRVPVLQQLRTTRGQHNGPAPVPGYSGRPVQATSGELATVLLPAADWPQSRTPVAHHPQSHTPAADHPSLSLQWRTRPSRALQQWSSPSPIFQ